MPQSQRQQQQRRQRRRWRGGGKVNICFYYSIFDCVAFMIWPWRVNIAFVGLRCTEIKKKNILYQRIKRTVKEPTKHENKNYTYFSPAHTLALAFQFNLIDFIFNFLHFDFVMPTQLFVQAIRSLSMQRRTHRYGRCDSIGPVNINLNIFPISFSLSLSVFLSLHHRCGG